MEQTQTTAKKGRFFGLRFKLIVGFTLLFSLLFSLAFLWFYSFASNSALNQIREDMMSTLDGAIAGIDGDEFTLLTKVTVPNDRDVPSQNPLYQRHQGWLASISDVEPRAIPYTFVPGDKPYQVLWIGDIFRIIRPDSQTTFRQSYIADPANSMLHQGLTADTVNMDAYSDQWGTWVSAYGPIHNSRGEVVGGLGIDFQANYVAQVQRAIRRQVLIAFLIAFPIHILLVWFMSSAVTRSLNELTSAAARIGEGDYDQDLTELADRRFPDEMSTLAQVFEIMMSKVRTREQTLRQQVAELKIEIDESKHFSQVNEIVESDFFQGLQVKAQALRAKRNSADDRRTKEPAPTPK